MMNIGSANVAALILAAGIPLAAQGEPSVTAQQEINALLANIELSGCEFYRNGSWYNSKMARAHLRDKYNYLVRRDLINAAEDFIEKAATESSMTGKPYQVTCSGREAVPSGHWLRDELARYRELQLKGGNR
jgi:hypothetical protein